MHINYCTCILTVHIFVELYDCHWINYNCCASSSVKNVNRKLSTPITLLTVHKSLSGKNTCPIMYMQSFEFFHKPNQVLEAWWIFFLMFSLLCLDACDMGKILSDATLCQTGHFSSVVCWIWSSDMQQEPKLVFYDWKPQILAKITLSRPCDKLPWLCDLWHGPNFILSGSPVMCDWWIDWNCTVPESKVPKNTFLKTQNYYKLNYCVGIKFTY